MCALSLICGCGIRKSGPFCSGCSQPSLPVQIAVGIPLVQTNPQVVYTQNQMTPANAFQPVQNQAPPGAGYPPNAFQPVQNQAPPGAGYPPGFGQPPGNPNPYVQQPFNPNAQSPPPGY